VLSPPTDILPSLKVSGDIEKIHSWVDENIAGADAMILSAEMYLYGGLIASRISNDTTQVIEGRLQKLIDYSDRYQGLEMYVSNVVMRIPSYDGDFEEPWYWKDYGDELFTYSYYLDKYNQLNNTEDLTTSQEAVKNVPSSAVQEFEWRRSRNHNITMRALADMSSRKPFAYFYTTLDDSAEFGYNIREAQEIKDFISGSQSGLSFEVCPVYPGADEVHLTMLARLSVTDANQGRLVTLANVYRDPNNVNAIPGYEGQPMVDTLNQQITAAGGVAVDQTSFSTADAVLLVNNFYETSQAEASQQTFDCSNADFSMFDKYVDFALSGSSDRAPPLGFCDNHYANGGDFCFVNYMNDRVAGLKLQGTTYAGWNTNGNTIGTVVANTIILSLFHKGEENAAFNSLRILEDMWYQGQVRTQLMNFVNQITNTDESTSNLTPDLSFYERYTFKLLSSAYSDISSGYNVPNSLQSTYFPWNRTFEIGLMLEY